MENGRHIDYLLSTLLVLIVCLTQIPYKCVYVTHKCAGNDGSPGQLFWSLQAGI